ncbi:MAG TPA: hypothetical protein VF209_04815 [Patescibacteria group bacterium]
MKKSITVEALPTQIARGVVRAPDVHPKTGEKYTHEVLFTIRPGWSKTGKYLKALPGGKIDPQDFNEIIGRENSDDPHFVLTLDQLIQAGLNAVEREIFEELGILFSAGFFKFVEQSTNKSGWTTYSYVADLPRKPSLVVKPDSAGGVWINEGKLINGRPQLLQGHLGITRRALKTLNK